MTSVVINSDKTISINGIKTFPQIFYWMCGYDGYTGENCVANLNTNSVYDADILMYGDRATIPEHETTHMPYLLDIDNRQSGTNLYRRGQGVEKTQRLQD